MHFILGQKIFGKFSIMPGGAHGSNAYYFIGKQMVMYNIRKSLHKFSRVSEISAHGALLTPGFFCIDNN
jgi:hypothetical protein